MAAKRQVGIDSVFERDRVELLEPSGLVLGEGLVGEVGQRRSAPQFERRAQALRRSAGFAAVERLPPLRGEALEAVRIDLIRHRPRAHNRRRG